MIWIDDEAVEATDVDSSSDESDSGGEADLGFVFGFGDGDLGLASMSSFSLRRIFDGDFPGPRWLHFFTYVKRSRAASASSAAHLLRPWLLLRCDSSYPRALSSSMKPCLMCLVAFVSRAPILMSSQKEAVRFRRRLSGDRHSVPEVHLHQSALLLRLDSKETVCPDKSLVHRRDAAFQHRGCAIKSRQLKLDTNL